MYELNWWLKTLSFHFNSSVFSKARQVYGGGWKPAPNMKQGGHFAYTENQLSRVFQENCYRGLNAFKKRLWIWKCLWLSVVSSPPPQRTERLPNRGALKWKWWRGQAVTKCTEGSKVGEGGWGKGWLAQTNTLTRNHNNKRQEKWTLTTSERR